MPGILTNAPRFDSHEINLRNFVNLTAVSAGQIRVGASVLSPIGSGSGLLGIPDDWTTPSRFVRIAAMRHFAVTPEDAVGGVILAEHLRGSVSIPRGLELVQDESSARTNFTRWFVIAKDIAEVAVFFAAFLSLALTGQSLVVSHGWHTQ